jgi:hypothetical protein
MKCCHSVIRGLFMVYSWFIPGLFVVYSWSIRGLFVDGFLSKLSKQFGMIGCDIFSTFPSRSKHWGRQTTILVWGRDPLDFACFSIFSAAKTVNLLL